jgi:TetR/AcrR family transcriptional regulator
MHVKRGARAKVTTSHIKTDDSAPASGRRAGAKRVRIVQAAMRRFAELGYRETRAEDIARELGIAKGSIFQHFGSKEGLFLEAYKRAVCTFPSYLDAPPDTLRGGFFATLRYWLERTRHLVHDDIIPYRVTLLGNYGSDLRLRRAINRYLANEDPYGTSAFVRMGIDRGEVRNDIDPEMIVSMVDWTMERFQDALLVEELDPGLLRRHGEPPGKMEARIDQFLKLLRGAIGSR